MIKTVSLVVLAMLLTGCNNSSVVMFEELPKEGWHQDEWKSFTYTHRLPKKEAALSLLLRHDDHYPYANIYLITEQINPKGVTQVDTLNYVLAQANGKWLGNGFFIKEHQLPFVGRLMLDEPGKYRFRVRPAVRSNDLLTPEKTLTGIHQIGLEITPLPHD